MVSPEMWHIPPPPSATRLKMMYSDLLGPAPFRPSEGEGEAKFCITLYILWLMNVFINVLGNFSSYPDFFNQRFPQMFVYLLIRVLHLIFRACTNRTDGTFCDFVTDLWCSGIQSYIWIFHPRRRARIQIWRNFGNWTWRLYVWWYELYCKWYCWGE